MNISGQEINLYFLWQLLPVISCPATIQCPGYSMYDPVISISRLLEDFSHLALCHSCIRPWQIKQEQVRSHAKTSVLELRTHFGLSQHMSWFSKLVFFWGGCHHVLQQLSTHFWDSVGVNPPPLSQWQNSHQLQGDKGVFSSLWAQCNISSPWHAMPMLCVSHVSRRLFDTTTIGLY